MLTLLLTYPNRRRESVGKGPPPLVFAVFVVLGSVTVMGMLIYTLGWSAYQAGVYLVTLTINFFTTAFAFVTALDVIMQQPVKFDGTPR